MNDMMKTITPKSDQLNADDLVGGHTITIKINRTDVKESGEQKVTLGYEGDNGKPYKPGKAMSHVLIAVWGKSSKEYIGKYLTLYRDEKVKFGPDVTGGIRISHMSHIQDPRTVIIPVSRGIRKPFTVQPLIIDEPPPLEDFIHDISKSPSLDGLKTKHDEAVRLFKDDESRKKIVAAKEKRKLELTPPKEPVA